MYEKPTANIGKKARVPTVTTSTSIQHSTRSSSQNNYIRKESNPNQKGKVKASLLAEAIIKKTKHKSKILKIQQQKRLSELVNPLIQYSFRIQNQHTKKWHFYTQTANYLKRKLRKQFYSQ